MTYSDAIRFLYDLRWFGAKFGLSNTRKLAALAGNPQDQLRFIHIAGTNGKGSTAAMLESIYRSAGLRVGLFTSPHLVAFGERIQVNRELLPETETVRLVREIQGLLREGWGTRALAPGESPGSPALAATDEHPTFFEAVTVMALRYFAAQKCDLVVWETGLGGRLDATNIVTPLASVITNIQYDHQKYLGETLAGIAFEKAGIIKPGVPVVTGADAPDALAVIRETALRLEAPLEIVDARQAHAPPLDSLQLPLLGEHQKMNAAVALAAVRAVAKTIPVPVEAVGACLVRLDWPGRLQIVTRPSGQRVLLDGAHNIDGARTLATALRQYFPGVKTTLVLGILRDKDWSHMCQLLAPLAERIFLVPVNSERSAEPQGLAEVCHQANAAARVLAFPSLGEALQAGAGDPFLTIAGSLYLVGEAMELFQLAPHAPPDERGLNEWGLPKSSGNIPGGNRCDVP